MAPVFFVEFLLDVVRHGRLDCVLVQRVGRHLDRILLHLIRHVDGLDDRLRAARSEDAGWATRGRDSGPQGVRQRERAWRARATRAAATLAMAAGSGNGNGKESLPYTVYMYLGVE